MKTLLIILLLIPSLSFADIIFLNCTKSESSFDRFNNMTPFIAVSDVLNFHRIHCFKGSCLFGDVNLKLYKNKNGLIENIIYDPFKLNTKLPVKDTSEEYIRFETADYIIEINSLDLTLRLASYVTEPFGFYEYTYFKCEIETRKF